VSGTAQDEIDVIVVANGCTDDTAAVAASIGSPVRVLSVPVASKREALAAGDLAANGYPRVYLDADVELRAEDVQALAEALNQPGVLAAGPRRVLATAESPWPVRWYYDIWTRLPEVRTGLFGRGVIAVSEAGHKRVASLPPLLSDDLAGSLVFAPHERVIVDGARVIVHPPRTINDLLRRRVRVVTGVTQIERTPDTPDSVARTRLQDLVTLIEKEPRMAPRLLVFLTVTAFARLRGNWAARRQDYSTWLRDESSRG
jgi:glycosyltransferase involved in cell wall biosynthesis